MKVEALTEQQGSTNSNGQPPIGALVDMISGVWISRIIYVAAKLGIADLLMDGPKSSDELAQATGTEARSLYRVLRALAGLGLFTEVRERTFDLTPMAECLRTGPDTLRAYALLHGEPWQWRSWEEALYSVKTGKPAFEHVFGTGMWNYFGKHREAGQTFDNAMISFSGLEIAAVMARYDFAPFTTVVDVGGGSGHFLAAILKENPRQSGILYDLPGVVEGAAKRLITAEDLLRRYQFIGGDCMKYIPDGGDAYLLKHVIHLFRDDQAITVLKNCRSAMEKPAKLLLVEMIIPPGNEPFYGKLLDVMMLVGPGGCDRTEAEYRALLSAGGFTMTRVIPTDSPVSVIEAVPE